MKLFPLSERVWMIYLYVNDIRRRDGEKQAYKALIYLLTEIEDDLQIWHDKCALEDEDSRTGEETYGYKSKSQILDQFEYLSDRVGARFRLRWVLDLLQRKDME